MPLWHGAQIRKAQGQLYLLLYLCNTKHRKTWKIEIKVVRIVTEGALKLTGLVCWDSSVTKCWLLAEQILFYFLQV